MRRSLFGAMLVVVAATWIALRTGAQLREPAPIPQEMTRRSASLHAVLQPSARSWVQQQARLEAQKTAPDVAGLQNALRGRFSSLSTANGSADIEEMVFIVLMDAENDADQDLQDQMAQMKAATNAKAELRAIQEKLQQIQAQLSAEMAKAGQNAACTNPVCRELPQQLDKLAADTVSLAHPVRIVAPRNLTYGQVGTIQTQLQNGLNSLNEMSEMTSMRLQMAMDRRSKFVETLSNIMKKISDTSDSIVANLK
jgi:hypothetical protein